MVEPKAWFAGVDWASEAHHVCVVSGDGSKREERTFRHGGAGLAEMADWIVAKCGGSAPDIPVAIEVPHGPVVESLMDPAVVRARCPVPGGLPIFPASTHPVH